jgi:hypothetical protein
LRVYHAVPQRPMVFCETVFRGVGSAKLRPTRLSALRLCGYQIQSY